MPDSDNNVVLVSFCMSTYKRPELLRSTLATIAKQEITQFEVIISDNDPEKSAEAVVETMQDKRFRYSCNGENLGMIKSFNKSVYRAVGEYIVMITDDDPVYPDLLLTLLQLQKDNPGYGLYLGGCDWFCTHPDVAALYNLKIGTNSCLSSEHEINYTQACSAEEFLKLFFTFKLFPHYLWSTAMVRRDVLVNFGGLPDYGTPFLGDYAYLGLMSSHSGCVIINKALGCQTLHKENFGRNQHEQIIVAANFFPAFLEERMNHLKEWPLIHSQLLRFTGMWVVSHMAFLYKYGQHSSLREAEKAVYKISYMKQYRFKYFLKTRMPFIHDMIVKLKKTFSK